MKQAVLQRDGLTHCYWCRKPFATVDDATLEHIVPIADGGQHELSNCTLACEKCNLRNVPKVVVEHQTKTQKFKADRAAANRQANGGDPEDCDAELVARFAAITRSTRGKRLSYADASFLLKTIHRQLGRQSPTSHEKHVFKGHYNRWLTSRVQQALAKRPPN